MEKELTDNQIRADILHKLQRKIKWGGAHTPFDKLVKWCDHRYIKRYKEMTRQLIKEGYIAIHHAEFNGQ